MKPHSIHHPGETSRAGGRSTPTILVVFVLVFTIGAGCSVDPGSTCDPGTSSCEVISDAGGDSSTSGPDTDEPDATLSNAMNMDMPSLPDADGGEEPDTTDEPEEPDEPLRLVLFYTPHGSVPNAWPTSEQPVAELPVDLGDVLSPLSAYNDEITIINGLQIDAEALRENEDEILSTHGTAPAIILTGKRGTTRTANSGFDFTSGGGPSFDLLLGEQLSAYHSSLVLGGGPLSFMEESLTWREYDQPEVPEHQPVFAMSRLFHDSSDLDIVALKTRAEQVDDEDFPALIDVQMDIAVAALATDLTQIVVLQVDTQLGPTHYDFLGVPRRVNQAAHEEDDADWRTIQRYYASEFVSLVSRLKEAGLGESTVVVWFSETGKNSRAHSMRDLPVVYRGDFGGRLRTGSLVSLEERRFHDLLATFALAMDVEMSEIGDFQVSPITTLLLP